MEIPGNNSLSIGVLASRFNEDDRPLLLAARLSLPLVPASAPQDFDFLLFYTAEGLVLKHTRPKGLGQLTVDFTSPEMIYRVKHGGGRKQAIARAVGLKKGWQPHVLDATAGLGRDAFILACLGCRVNMFERSPVLAALLEDAWQRALHSDDHTKEIVTERLRFTRGDSRHYLQLLRPEECPDVICLDPMYPERSKSSLVKKEMRILRMVAGDDPDGVELLATALLRARKRVVVKRPRLAPILGHIPPSHQVTGKSSRFDVYLL